MMDNPGPSVPERFRLAEYDSLPRDVEGRFLSRVFPGAKAEFLLRHGEWWHRGRSNRLTLLDDQNQVAAYCAFIPARCLIGGKTREAAWWIDLVVLPEYRGLGLQSILDREMRDRFDLLLGFPNVLAAGIHRKHGWGVTESGRAMLLPLRLSRLRALRRQPPASRAVLTLLAKMIDPMIGLAARRCRRADDVVRFSGVDSSLFASVFDRFYRSTVMTTDRCADYFRWRFEAAPFATGLRCYGAFANGETTLVMITRTVTTSERRVTRVLDLFGDLSDHARLLRLIHSAVADARDEGSEQLTAVAFRPELQRAFRRAGFFFASPVRFCWDSPDPQTMAQIAGSCLDWGRADSDNDEPE